MELPSPAVDCLVQTSSGITQPLDLVSFPICLPFSLLYLLTFKETGGGAWLFSVGLQFILISVQYRG